MMLPGLATKRCLMQLAFLLKVSKGYYLLDFQTNSFSPNIFQSIKIIDEA